MPTGIVIRPWTLDVPILSQGVFWTMFIDSKVARTFNYLWTIEAQLIEIKETSLSTTNMGDLSQVPVITCLEVLAHPYPGTEAVFDLSQYQGKLSPLPQARGSLLVAHVLSLRSLPSPPILPLSSDYIWP
jgi:hypothetical protein